MFLGITLLMKYYIFQKVLEHKDSIIEVPHGSKLYVGETPIDLDNILIFIEE